MLVVLGCWLGAHLFFCQRLLLYLWRWRDLLLVSVGRCAFNTNVVGDAFYTTDGSHNVTGALALVGIIHKAAKLDHSTVYLYLGF